jgi:integrase
MSFPAIWTAHSSLKVTTDIYSHWERAERKLRAAKMEGAFPV